MGLFDNNKKQPPKKPQGLFGGLFENPKPKKQQQVIFDAFWGKPNNNRKDIKTVGDENEDMTMDKAVI